jgi:multidrug efflux pump subunit AcrB
MATAEEIMKRANSFRPVASRGVLLLTTPTCQRGVLVLLGVLLVGGCWRGAPPAAPLPLMISLSLPEASPRDMDAVACGPLCESLARVVGVQGITCVSREGQATVYVEARPGVVSDFVFLTSIHDAVGRMMPRWPAKMTVASPQQVPAVPDLSDLPIREVPRLRVQVDREQAARYGVTVVEVEKLAAAHRDASPEELGKLPITLASGEQVPLSAVARLEMVAEPDCVVRRSGVASGSTK